MRPTSGARWGEAPCRCLRQIKARGWGEEIRSTAKRSKRAERLYFWGASKAKPCEKKPGGRWFKSFSRNQIKTPENRRNARFSGAFHILFWPFIFCENRSKTGSQLEKCKSKYSSIFPSELLHIHANFIPLVRGQILFRHFHHPVHKTVIVILSEADVTIMRKPVTYHPFRRLRFSGLPPQRLIVHRKEKGALLHP